MAERIKRGKTLQNIVDTKIPVFEFDGEWEEAFGQPQTTGIWYVYGDSGNGKTSFILLLIKKLAEYGKVLFVSYEEGDESASLKEGIVRFGLLSADSKVLVVTDTLEDLKTRLLRRRSANIVIIDSLEESEFRNYKQLRKFTNEFPDKLFVFIGQAPRNKPAGQLGENVLFGARQKIQIEGFRAISRGRSFGKVGYLTIWDEKARMYWDYK